MANTARGEFEITSNGKTYTGCLKMHALIALQHHFSSAAGELIGIEDVLKLIDPKSVEHVGLLFWASLRKYHPEIDRDQALNVLDDCEDQEQIDSMYRTLLLSGTPDKADVAELKLAKRPRRARATSGESGTSKLAKPA